MLDEQLEHIVFVHYREVKEGCKLGASHLLNADSGFQLGSPQASSVSYFEGSISPVPIVQSSYTSSPKVVDWNGQAVASEFGNRDSGENSKSISNAHSVHLGASSHLSFCPDDSTGLFGLPRNHFDSVHNGACFNPCSTSSLWTNIQGTNRNLNITNSQKLYFEKSSTTDFSSHKLIGPKLDSDGNGTEELDLDAQRVTHEYNVHLTRPHSQKCSRPLEVPSSTAEVENSSQVGEANNDESGALKKLDSFGRWMDKEIGGDCDDSLMASDSGNYWNTLNTDGDDKEVSSLSRHMQLDAETLGPSLSQEQLYSIHDFAPDWAYSGVETKVLITGSFLVDKNHSTRYKWCCMFGEIEVSAEVLTDNVIRCQVPFHVPGRVPFYVTCSNRLACSEVREFEYSMNPSRVESPPNIKHTSEDDVQLQTQLAKLLCFSLERKWLDCFILDCDKCKLKPEICSLKSDGENGWGRLEQAVSFIERNHTHLRDALIQNLLKDKLYEWLICKAHEGGKGPHVLDDEGQGVIHLAAALGYYWAMGPIAAAEVSPNFRDARGRTALHWAAYFGREETVIMLVRLGTAPGAVDDPTPSFPGGQTAADLASDRGYKGIAGFLAEADLTCHLSSLNISDNVMESAVSTIAAEKAIETVTQDVASNRTIDGELSLKGSLAAVKKSAHAAALIQATFRIRSFRQRELNRSIDNVSEASLDLVALGCLNKIQKVSNFEDYLHSAAIKIQQKYRGWKGRKEFLKIRKRIVKIQAHVRGHQVRKHYKKVVWSVSIVEKVILRWRRKKTGLRGFRIEKTNEDSIPESQKNDEYEFLSIGRKQKFDGVEKALARVQSMVRHPEARDQYMRMVMKSEDSKLKQ